MTCWQRLAILVLCCSAFLDAYADTHGGDTVVDLGARRELFVDYLLIDELRGTSLKLQTPRPAGTAIRYDLPWEGEYCFYSTVLHDGDV